MKKILFCLLCALLLAGGTVFAASVNGDYKGYPVVNVVVDGKKVESDVPAISLDGRTMVPVRFVSDALGADVAWDQKTYTVSIKKPIAQSNTKATVKEIAKKATDYKGYAVTLEYTEELSSLKINQRIVEDIGENVSNSINLAALARNLDVDEVAIYYDENGNLTSATYIKKHDILDFLNYKLSIEEFVNKWEIVTNGTSGNTFQLPSLPVNNSYPELYSNDGKTYLGKLTTNTFDKDSVFNEFGTYGSKYSQQSIFNELGTYGSSLSNESAFNNLATKPPKIVLKGKVIGYLTTNNTITNAISPYDLFKWLQDNGY